MKKILIILVAALTLSACTATERGATLGAGAGAVIGGATTGTLTGAAIGAAVGGVSGAVLGRVAGDEANCYYENQYGRTYKAPCPQG